MGGGKAFLIAWILEVVSVAVTWGARCEKIAVPACQNLPYNTTLMPNFMQHEDQREAARGLGEFGGFLEHNCSAFLKLFVCSVYVPLCSEHVPGAVPACRGLCEEVRRGCLPALLSANLSWPAQLECSTFPEPPKLCMQQPMEEDFIGGVAGNRNEDNSGEHLHGGFNHNLRHCPHDTALSGDKCLKVCQSNETHSKTEYLLFELWTAIWSFFCLLFTMFALLTFLIQPNRFRWPARPIIYLSLCGFITSLVYIFRWILGPFTCSGETILVKPSDSFLCVGASSLIIFCDMAFVLWWCTFCLVWFLSAAREWSTEAIEKISTRLHTTIWTLSILPVIYSLMSNNIKMDTLTGFCTVTSFILHVFELCFVIIGSFVGVLTSVALKNVRSALMYAGRSPFKLDRLICRLGVISLGICAPLFVSLMCNFFTGLTVTLLQVGLKLLSAIFAALWVFSSKTFKSWNKILRPTSRNKGEMPVAKV